MIIDGVSTEQITLVATGFFFVLALTFGLKLRTTPKRFVSKRYVTEMPAKLIIEEDASA